MTTKATPAKTYKVLFLCTANSARSILAESLINHWGQGRFQGFSAGSFPRGEVHPYALDLLRSLNMPVAGLRSKSWDEFTPPGVAPMDFVFTVCDQAAAEVCPVWPGNPVTAHWGVPDPAANEGSEAMQRAAFRETFRVLENRIKIFCNLRPEAIDKMSLQREAENIGRTTLMDTAS